MPYGFVIAHSASPPSATGVLETLPDNLHNLIAEVRVEQDLSRPAKFAVRFEEDICEGERILGASVIQPGGTVAVLVPGSDDSLVCLTMGQVTKLKSSAVTGGPGSWFEIQGEDLRTRMGRTTQTVQWTGTATGIAKSVFDLHGLSSDVMDCDTPNFPGSEAEPAHNQSGPDLQLLDNFARMLGYEFWFEYDVTVVPPKSFLIEPTAKFRPSPDNPALSGAMAAPPISIDLLGGGDEPVLRLDPAEGCCRNITTFRVDVDAEKATLSLADGVNAATGEIEESVVADGSIPVDSLTTRRVEQFGCTRTLPSTPEGSAPAREAINRSILAEQGWFVTAAASTSAHLLPGVVEAHDIVNVEGNGFQHSGKYHVSKVVHVVKPWGHLMDLSLRRNALPEAAGA